MLIFWYIFLQVQPTSSIPRGECNSTQLLDQKVTYQNSCLRKQAVMSAKMWQQFCFPSIAPRPLGVGWCQRENWLSGLPFKSRDWSPGLCSSLEAAAEPEGLARPTALSHSTVFTFFHFPRLLLHFPRMRAGAENSKQPTSALKKHDSYKLSGFSGWGVFWMEKRANRVHVQFCDICSGLI